MAGELQQSAPFAFFIDSFLAASDLKSQKCLQLAYLCQDSDKVLRFFQQLFKKSKQFGGKS